ncbi:Putative aliphatic sulfonates-binding protein [Alphaproteobacteria bacterium SO-S41]|nr:Putative aliphatic sulfonates-binding protein [Alphaproteobacteria bacterium SO-S41]
MSLIDRRTLLLGGLSLAGLAACSPAAKPQSLADVTLRVATYRGNIEAAFEAAGVANTPYKIAFAEFVGGNLIAEAINAGAIDVGSMSEIPPVFIVPSNRVLRLVAVRKGDVNAQLVLVPGNSAITDLTGLKGKRIGYVRATTSHYIMLRLLTEAGLTVDDITPIALSPQDGLAAFERGELDAWVIYGIQGYLARNRGALVLTTGLGRLSGNYVYAASVDALNDDLHRAAIVDFLERSARAHEWANTHVEEWATLIAEKTGAPKEVFIQQHAERSRETELARVDDDAIASQQLVADVFADAAVIPAKVDVRPLWDARLNAEINKVDRAT